LWLENQSNDQTLLLNYGRTVVLFDERAQYKNPDYDVSFSRKMQALRRKWHPSR